MSIRGSGAVDDWVTIGAGGASGATRAGGTPWMAQRPWRPGRAPYRARPGTGLVARQPTLACFGVAMVAAAIPSLMLMAVDDRRLLGVNVWEKPTRFFVSIGIYALTLAWAFAFLSPEQHSGRAARSVVAVTVGAGALEQAIITVRAALGQQSHFNVVTSADAAWFSLMGVGAVLLVSTAAVTGAMVWRSGVLAGARRVGWSAGLFIAGLLGGMTGWLMASSGSHLVGEATGDPHGLPVLGWSTSVGDLRIAHFLALHSIFVLPLVGWAADRRWGKRPIAAGVTWAATILWVGAVVSAFANAMAGNPL